MPGEGVVSLEKEIFPKLIARRKLLGFVTRQRFYDIGTSERLQLIESVLAHDPH
jgi:NDP-sugar pyrophosphorylase family protein